MSTGTKVLIGCACVAGAGICFMALIVALFVYAAGDIEGVTVTINAPMEVVKGEEFALVVNIQNTRASKPLKVSSIDIAEDYLQGFFFVSSDPTAKSSEHVPFDNSRSFKFDLEVPPGQTTAVTFNLRPTQAGVYRGDLDVCEGMRFTTTLAQTSVTEQ